MLLQNLLITTRQPVSCCLCWLCCWALSVLAVICPVANGLTLLGSWIVVLKAAVRAAAAEVGYGDWARMYVTLLMVGKASVVTISSLFCGVIMLLLACHAGSCSHMQLCVMSDVAGNCRASRQPSASLWYALLLLLLLQLLLVLRPRLLPLRRQQPKQKCPAAASSGIFAGSSSSQDTAA